MCHLHSTMLLLYQDSRWGRSYHFTIYIPLCFYFISLPAASNACSSIFTFHYASTLSASALVDNIDALHQFTFHYASTLSKEEEQVTIFVKYLHSTMLLLYLAWQTMSRLLIRFIYIPLCFYFILTGWSPSAFRLPFTFHYASTLSPCSKCSVYHLLYLHSTMLLLYRVLGWGLRKQELDLHSTMLLLYLPLSEVLLPCMSTFTFHYASTLSRRKRSCGIELLSFTFHYASTLSSLQLTHYYTLDIIYIPLCFYFIRAYALWNFVQFLIYIPLCFYFIDRDAIPISRPCA